MKVTRPLADRFWSKVDRRGPDECWPWTASRWPQGYGYFGIGSTAHVRSHRQAWELAHDDAVPDGMCVLHSCDNPPCCNPAHLFLGTIADNNADMRRKGRQRDSAVLTGDGARHAKILLDAGESVMAVARTLRVDPGTIKDVRDGRTSRHRQVDGGEPLPAPDVPASEGVAR